jgi:SAM-dependent methyltransferase
MLEPQVEKRIQDGDPWYTEDQHAAAVSSAQVRVVRRRVELILRVVTDLKAHLGKRDSVRILDAGCGDGVILRVLAGIADAEVWGVDYNPLRIQRARAAAPTVRVMQGDLTSLQFPPGHFDLVILNQVLEHVPNDRAVLEELTKVLSDAGWLLLGVPNEGCLLARLRNRVIQRSIGRTTDHVHFYTELTVRSLLGRAGIRVRSLFREGFFTPYFPFHSWLSAREWGHAMLEWLGRVFPSQAAGIYLLCEKSTR